MDLKSPCCCCRLRESKKDLTTPYSHFGRTEIYSDMIQECFNIHVRPDVAKHGICEMCVDRLRDASDFKALVQCSQEELLAQLGYKYEIPIVNIMDDDTASIPRDTQSEYVDTTEELSVQVTNRPSGQKGVVPHPCQICKKTYNNETNLMNHIKDTHGEEISAGNSRNTFVDQFQMFCLANNSGSKTEAAEKRCKEEGALSSKSAYRHGLDIGLSQENAYTCEICALVFPTNIRLALHRKTHKKKKVHACHLCNKIYKKKYLLTNHILTHTGERPFSCETCNKQFVTRTALISHQYVHGTESFICDICNKKFTRKKTLNLHILAHSGVKNFECDQCEMKFSYAGSLRLHKLIHTGEKPFECSVCHKRFRRKCHLAEHMNAHTDIKLYECDECDMRFTYQSSIRNHKLIHTGAKPFECSLCHKRFRQKHKLKVHMNTHAGQRQ